MPLDSGDSELLRLSRRSPLVTIYAKEHPRLVVIHSGCDSFGLCILIAVASLLGSHPTLPKGSLNFDYTVRLARAC